MKLRAPSPSPPALARSAMARFSSTKWPRPSGFAMTTAEKPHSNGAALTLAERSERVDRVVIDAAAPLLAQTGVAVLAVGGYGRRQLFPYSDVDILILFESERLLAAAKEAVSTFLQKLWDSALHV